MQGFLSTIGIYLNLKYCNYYLVEKKSQAHQSPDGESHIPFTLGVSRQHKPLLLNKESLYTNGRDFTHTPKNIRGNGNESTPLKVIVSKD